MISCSEAVSQLWNYLENDLETDDRARIQAHLTLCRRCCGEVEFTEALRDLLSSTGGPILPDDVERQFVGFLDALEKEAP